MEIPYLFDNQDKLDGFLVGYFSKELDEINEEIKRNESR